MSLTLELLRMETDREPFWPHNSGLISAVPHDCPKKATVASATTNNNNNNNVNNNKVHNGLSPHFKRHSYYECCVHVEVSALLEHWLGWDDHPHVAGGGSDATAVLPKLWADRLVSGLAVVDPTEEDDDQDKEDCPRLTWVRKFCSEIGCDVLKKQDANGKTLLHHLLSGAVKRNLASAASILLEAGTPHKVKDAEGHTPLHLVKNLLIDTDIHEVCSLVSVLAQDLEADDLDLPDNKGRSILTYSVEAGDRALHLTRMLVNLGADPEASFAWYLRSQMSKSELDDLDEDTLYVLSTAVMEKAGGGQGLKAMVDRTMVALGTSKQVHGPLFRKIRGLLAHNWLRPPQLRSLAVKSLRRSLGPKRLSKGHAVMSRLKVPRKLQRFITLEEQIPPQF